MTKRNFLTAILAGVIIFLLVGCVTSNSHEEHFSNKLHELRIAEVNQWPNSILVGEMFPDGRTVPVSDGQARRLQRVLSEARPVEGDPADSGRLISPAPRLCALNLAGQTWYFMPPGQPVMFLLPDPQQVEFERILRTDFDITD